VERMWKSYTQLCITTFFDRELIYRSDISVIKLAPVAIFSRLVAIKLALPAILRCIVAIDSPEFVEKFSTSIVEKS
jgi:hypothetical protein